MHDFMETSINAALLQYQYEYGTTLPNSVAYSVLNWSRANLLSLIESKMTYPVFCKTKKEKSNYLEEAKRCVLHTGTEYTKPGDASRVLSFAKAGLLTANTKEIKLFLRHMPTV